MAENERRLTRMNSIEREDYLAVKLEQFERDPKPIADFFAEEVVPIDVQPELERMLRAVLLLRATARALDRFTAEPEPSREEDEFVLSPGCVVLVDSSVNELRARDDVEFVMVDDNGRAVRGSRVQIEVVRVRRDRKPYLAIAAY
jgi:hypothetical protein